MVGVLWCVSKVGGHVFDLSCFVSQRIETSLSEMAKIEVPTLFGLVGGASFATCHSKELLTLS